MASVRLRAICGFACFGLFWGAWGAVLPAVKDGAGVGDGQLGLALLMIGLGALLSMRAAGLLIDRFGGAVLPAAVALFAVCGLLPAFATSATTLAVALFLLGATSGAADVAINTAGSHAEAVAGRPVMNLGHAFFSIAVVVASLGTAGLRAAGAGALPVLGAVLALIALAVLVVLAPGAREAGPAVTRDQRRRRQLRPRFAWPDPALLVFGGLCALAYVVENAWQSWSALHLDATLGAGPGLASSAPAVFAGAAVVGRLGGNALLSRIRPVPLLVAGSLVAAVGSALAALADGPGPGLAGIALAGLGTSVCAPTIIGMTGSWAGPERRAAAISTVTTIAYLGFLLGPPAVGAVSGAWSLPVALGGVAVLAVVVAALSPVAGHAAGREAATSAPRP